jgi:hypothetical protein
VRARVALKTTLSSPVARFPPCSLVARDHELRVAREAQAELLGRVARLRWRAAAGGGRRRRRLLGTARGGKLRCLA